MPTFSDPDNEDSGGSLSEVTTAVRKVVEPDPLCVTTDVLVTEKAPVLDATGAEELVEAFVLDGRVDDDLGGTEAEEKLDDVIDGVGADEEVDALLALEWLRGRHLPSRLARMPPLAPLLRLRPAQVLSR